MRGLLFAPRFSRPVGAVLWAVWLAIVAWTTIEPTRIHVEYFSKLGQGVSTGLLAFLAACALAAWGYTLLRRRTGLWKREPWIALGLLVAACLVYRPLATLVVVGAAWIAFSAGRALLARFELPLGTGPGDVGLAAAAGAGWLGVTLYLLGTARIFSPPALLALAVLTAWIGRAQLRSPSEILRSWSETWRRSEGFRDNAVGVSVFFVYLFLGFGLAVALTPAINIDGIREHLRFAQITLDAGFFEATPYQRTSYYPWAFEILMASVQAFGGQAAAELVNPTIFLALLALSFGLVRRAGVDRRLAFLSIAVVATVPWLHRTGVVVKNDALLALFQLASLLAWTRAREERNDRWLWASTIFLALSLGVKHTAAFGAIPLSLMLLWSTWRKPRLVVGLAAAGLLFGGFWHLRAYQATGNPFFPLGARVATQRQKPKAEIQMPSKSRRHLTIPWAVHYRGRASFSSPTNNPAGMALPFFVVAWLLLRRRRRNQVELALLIFCLIYSIYWGHIWGIIRYYLAPFILLLGLTVARAGAFWETSGVWPRRLGLAALTWNFVFTVPPVMMMEINLPQLEYLAGRIDREQFLTQAVSGYRAMQELARLQQPEDDAISFYAEHLVFAPWARKIGLVYAGRAAEARRRQLLATRFFEFVVLAKGLQEETLQYEGAEDYQEVYADDDYVLWRRKSDIAKGEGVDDPNDVAVDLWDTEGYQKSVIERLPPSAR